MASKTQGKAKKTNSNFWSHIGMFFYNHKFLTILLWLVLVTYGALSYGLWMQKEGFPSVNVPVGVVRVISFGQEAETVDKSFIVPLTEQAQTDGQVKRIISSSTNLGATMQISFKDGTDVQESLDSLQENLEGKLPKNAQVAYIKVAVNKITPEGDDILISVHGDNLSPKELDAAAAKLVPILKERLTLAKNVHAYKLVESVTDSQSGKTRSEQVRFDRFFESDEAEGAKPSAIVGVAGMDDVDQLELYDEVQQVLASAEVQSVGARTHIAANFAEGIRSQISGLQRNLIEGLIVVILVSFLLISLRGSLVTALSMITTVVVTIGVLNLIGYTINTITLFSLVLCLALIVDDITIVVEAIDAGYKKGKKFSQVVSESLIRVARASSTGTLVTILAFAPMLFIGGILGEFIRAIPVTIIISLAVSLLCSVIFIPLFMRLSYGRKPMPRPRRFRLITRLEEAMSNGLARVMLWSVKTKARSFSTKLHAVFFALLFLGAGALIFKSVEFNIFPSPKDGRDIIITAQVKNKQHAEILQTEKLTDKVLAQVQTILGEDLERITLATGQMATRDGFRASLLLTPLDDRDMSSVELAERLQTDLEERVPQMLIQAEAVGVGPPESDFVVQITGDEVEKSQVLATDIRQFLETTTLERIDGTTAQLTEIQVTPPNIVSRDDGVRIVEVRASFDANDISTLVTLAEDAVKEEFDADRIESYGLPADALQFDFGQEEENQESFNSMGKAAGPLFLAMFIFMAVLFRGIMQPLLIFLALPFAFFGVAVGLKLTDNPLSFFSMLGVFALVGISLNNTILLTDYANQAQREGKTAVLAMSSAIKARLRPLMATSLTSVLALLPLALNDPFWEGLAYTLIFGLLSSTILVILIFPYFYLIEEALRMRLRRLFGKA